MQDDLDAIIERCRKNDHKAFEVIYKRFYRPLLGVALRYASHTAEAEDILQDAYIKIFHSIGTYKETGSFEGWLKRIVRNTAINSYRNKLKFDLYIDVQEHEDTVSDYSFESVFESFDVKDMILMLTSMPEGYRVVINLYYIEGCSHKEIADLLNISAGTSKSQLFKARNFLKNLIETHNEVRIS